MSRDAPPEFAHLFWIGGSACGGKTSTAGELAERHGLEVYSCDRAFKRHRLRVDPVRHPSFHAIMNKSMEELWRPPAEEQRDELIAFYGEEFPMVLEDLRERAANGPLLVEGAGLLPPEVMRLVAEPHRFVLLIPSPEFRSTLTPRDGADVRALLEETKDPDRAYRNWMLRDVLYGRWLRSQADAAGARVIDNDGSRTIAEHADEVASWFRL